PGDVGRITGLVGAGQANGPPRDQAHQEDCELLRTTTHVRSFRIEVRLSRRAGIVGAHRSIRRTALGDFVGPMNSTMLPSGSFTNTCRRPVGRDTTSRR